MDERRENLAEVLRRVRESAQTMRQEVELFQRSLGELRASSFVASMREEATICGEQAARHAD